VTAPPRSPADVLPGVAGHGTRVVGALLGVAGGEAYGGGTAAGGEGADDVFVPVPWQRCSGRDGDIGGPVTTALLDLCHGYVARRGHGLPAEVAERSSGVAGPGWLLAVAMVRTDERQLLADTLELATVAGVSARSLGDYVAYVELAADLIAGRPPIRCAEAAHGAWLSGVGPRPRLCGEAGIDALSAGVWALAQRSRITEVMAVLAEVATPSVGAAALGLLGLRDGTEAVPVGWQRRLACTAACLALAPGLVRARCRDHARHGGRYGGGRDGLPRCFHAAGQCVKAGART
jgi:hypothetical protein